MTSPCRTRTLLALALLLSPCRWLRVLFSPDEDPLRMNTLQTTYVASAATLFLLVIARPHWLLRPSFAFACAMTVIINLSAAFVTKPGWPESSLTQSVRASAILFPLGIVAWIACTPFLSNTAKRLLSDCRNVRLDADDDRRNDRIVNWLLVAVTAAIACWYFATVPLQSTGLWAILFTPEKSAVAREESLKLLDSKLLPYAFFMCINVTVPVAMILYTLRLSYRRAITTSAMLITVAALILFIGITGARMPIAKAFLMLAIALALTTRSRRGLLVLPLSIIGAFGVITTLSFLREGLDSASPFAAMLSGISNRAFVIPFETGLLTTELASARGFLDGANVRPYALLTGQDHVSLSSEVYFIMRPGDQIDGIQSGLAPTSFLFDFQAGFGIWTGWWISLAAIGALDIGLLAFRRVRGRLLPALLSPFLFIAALDLTGSAYTTQLLTGGVGLIIILAIILPILLKPPASAEPPTTVNDSPAAK